MIKRCITVLSILTIAVTFTFGFMQLEDDYNAENSLLLKSDIDGIVTDTIAPVSFPYPTVFNFNYSAIPGMNRGTVGALWFNGKYYFNRWNNMTVYRYNDDGPGGGPGTLADSLNYQGFIKDLTTDGVWIYGGNASPKLFRFNPYTMETVKTFTLSGGAIVGVAWDPNRKGFWNSAFAGNILLHDTNGVLIKQLISTHTKKYV